MRVRNAEAQAKKPARGGLLHLFGGAGRDSPTSCRRRMRVHAHPFESRRKPRRRLPPPRSHAPASGRNRKRKLKSPHEAGFFICLAERDRTRLHPAGRGCACTRIPSSPAGSRAGGFLHPAVTRPQAGATGNANEKARARRAFSFVWRSGRDSPTSCRPRMRVHAHPFESRRKPRRRLPPLRSHAPASGRNSDSTNAKARTRRAFAFVWRSGRDSNPRPPA